MRSRPCRSSRRAEAVLDRTRRCRSVPTNGTRQRGEDEPWQALRSAAKYLARWREYAGGPQKYQMFARKVDAQNFLVDVQHRILSGTYTPPEAGQMTVAAYSEDWMKRRTWAPSTDERIRREFRLYINPKLGDRPLASLRCPHIEEWAKGLRFLRRAHEWFTRRCPTCSRPPSMTNASPGNPAKGARV